MRKTLKTYLKRLTNLTARNKSLLLLQLPQEQFLDIHELDFLGKTPSFHIISELIAHKSTIALCHKADSRYDKVNNASQKLRRIARTEKFIVHERGAKDLYIGFPVVKGKFANGTIVRCPLLFFPVSLATDKNTKTWELYARNGEYALFNRSFLLAYSHFNERIITDEWLEKTFDNFDTNPLVFITQLYNLLKDSPIELNFNQDLFSQKLILFEKTTKIDLEFSEKNGELKLYPQAILGVFPQAGSYLMPDYEQLINNPSLENGIFDAFASKYATSNIREENVLTPFPIDASQENAIRHITSGNSVVVEGPPGTGKSQLIANLVADFTAKGKNVLVVCQKRAALDTVFKRLQQANLQDFTALIHDFRNDRKSLFQQIASQIATINAYQQQNQSLDAIFLERTFIQTCRKIDTYCHELQTFHVALFDSSVCGLSPKELYLTSSFNMPFIGLSGDFKHFHFNDLDPFLEKLRRFSLFQQTVNSPAHRWSNRVSFRHFIWKDKTIIIETIQNIFPTTASLQTAYRQINNYAAEWGELLDAGKSGSELSFLFDKLNDDFVFDSWKKMLLSSENMPKKAQITKAKQVFDKNFNDTFPKKFDDQLDFLEEQLQEAIQLRNSWATNLLFPFSATARNLGEFAKAMQVGLSPAHLQQLLEQVKKRQKIANLRQKIPALTTIENIEEGILFFEKTTTALLVYELWQKLSPIFTSISCPENKTALILNMQQIQEIIAQIQQRQRHWLQYLSAEQITLLQSNVFENQLFINDLDNCFDNLVDADQAQAAFDYIEWKVAHLLLKQQPSNVEKLFQNSLRLAWLEYLEEQQPLLRCVSSEKMQWLEDELCLAVQKKQELSLSIVQLKLREKTYRNREFNRLQNTITYRYLQHQVTKKRNVWSIRQLVADHFDEIFRLIPCWLASPEAISAIFPMQMLFDIVIFDEASQCYAENGVPAIFRGKQLVIAGDSQQLQPNDLYRIRFENETDTAEPELEIESLLDLAKLQLPSLQLRGHYRSHSLDLISFSNQHFYQNTLKLIPYFNEINKHLPAIQYIKINGVWENNHNTEEAKKVVELLQELHTQNTDKSIGVITFNYPQQQLIEQLLENQQMTSDNIAVKNIENVQGDEYDLLIFSIGYAPNAQQKFTMQFGSLNTKGGENRLNVAITRAKERIYIITSILPQQLHTEHLLHTGVKLLKAYLEYAQMVSEGNFIPAVAMPKTHHATWFLTEQLIQQNHAMVQELPFADITIKNKQEYLSLLLTDDDYYHQAYSPKEPHAYLPQALRQRNWIFERKWSREFWQKNNPT